MSQIKSAFNKASNQYDDCAFLQKEIAQRLNQKLEVISTQPKTVLDLGAGTGLLSKHLIKRFTNAQLISLDFAQFSLQKNPAKHKLCADAHQLPLADNSMDIVVSNLMLQWCAKPKQLFAEIHRVLKNNGLVLFSTFGPDTLKELKKAGRWWTIPPTSIPLRICTTLAIKCSARVFNPPSWKWSTSRSPIKA